MSPSGCTARQRPQPDQGSPDVCWDLPKRPRQTSEYAKLRSEIALSAGSGDRAISSMEQHHCPFPNFLPTLLRKYRILVFPQPRKQQLLTLPFGLGISLELLQKPVLVEVHQARRGDRGIPQADRTRGSVAASAQASQRNAYSLEDPRLRNTRKHVQQDKTHEPTRGLVETVVPGHSSVINEQLSRTPVKETASPLAIYHADVLQHIDHRIPTFAHPARPATHEAQQPMLGGKPNDDPARFGVRRALQCDQLGCQVFSHAPSQSSPTRHLRSKAVGQPQHVQPQPASMICRLPLRAAS